jgi:hypothetical protein
VVLVVEKMSLVVFVYNDILVLCLAHKDCYWFKKKCKWTDILKLLVNHMYVCRFEVMQISRFAFVLIWYCFKLPKNSNNSTVL